MKVLILGPVIEKNKSGGVAVFDEGLYRGFKELGDDVNIVSVGKSINIDNICVSKKQSEKKFSSLKHFRKIAKVIRNIQPDMVICSLLYSLGINKYRRACKKATFIEVLHGFPCAVTGLFRTLAVNYVARYSKKRFDKTVTVSFLSYAINKRIYNISCDDVIINGCDFPLMISTNNERKYDCVFVGRLTKSKEIEMICDAFILINQINPHLRFAVAGYSDLESLFTNGKYANSSIEFVGQLTKDGVSAFLQNSKFFISLNSLEPFGIVFGEAIMNGCNVITTSTSGCASTFIKQDFFHIADCTNAADLAKRITEILPTFVEINLDARKEYASILSLKSMALSYKKLLK